MEELNELNYFSKENELKYCGSSQYKNFVGTKGIEGCESKEMAKLKGDWEEKPSIALSVGSYVDAYFSGTIEQFKKEHPEIFTEVKILKSGKRKGEKVGGELRAPYKDANIMISRVERDEYFMKTLAGGTQEIFTAEMFGIKWKIKVDFYHKGIVLVDLKTTQSIQKEYYVEFEGKVGFVEYWGYEIQAALYQKVVEIATGETLPFLIAAVSKESEPDIEIIGFDQSDLDTVIRGIEFSAPRIIELKAGKGRSPFRCEVCDYCKRTKKLSSPIHYKEIKK